MNIRKKTLVVATMLLLSISSMAIPAKKVWQDITLSNGTTITVRLVGDEYGHWYIDQQGKALTIDNGVANHMTAERLAERQALRQSRMTEANRLRSVRFEKNTGISANTTLRDAMQGNSATLPNGIHRAVTDVRKPLTGSKKGIVILVNFSDLQMTVGTQSIYNDMFNKVGYKSNNHIGSLHDYFLDQSYGQFDLTFDVVGPVTVSRSYTYYGQNGSDGSDKYPCSMVIEAIKLADKEGVDFSQYDWDGDGYVDQVYILYPGYGENAGAPANTLWPHEWELNSGKAFGDGTGAVLIDGVRVNTYAISSELADYSGKELNGIGLACHEFSHCLGYPDFYDTNYNNDGSIGTGMMDWDVLDNGSYNGPKHNGEVPASYTAYERWMAGWLTPIELEKPCYVTDMASITKEAKAYVIYNEGNYNECYLLENRQNDSWDAYVGGENTHGMLITHVNYSASTWRDNTVNAKSYSQGLTFIPADNSYGSAARGSYSQTASDYAGDPYPGTSRNSEFTDYSKPAATLYNANKDGRKFLGKPITEIAEKDGIISFTFNGGDSREDAPPLLEATNITENGFTANWEAASGADSYSLKLYKYTQSVKEASLILSQDCSKFEGSAAGSDNTTDISESLDDYMSTSGWLGSKIFEGPKRLKMGSSKVAGVLATPTMKAPKDGSVTVCLSQSTYGNDSKVMEISAVASSEYDDITSITEAQPLATVTIESAADADQGVNKTIRLNGITSDFRLVIKPAKRAYIYGIDMYEGNLSDEDLVSEAPMRKAVETVSGDTIVVNGITGNSYTFTNLAAGTYKYTIASVKNGEESRWSKPAIIAIVANGSDGITEIHGNGSQKRNGIIYNIRGQVVGSNANALPAGIYVRNGRKFVIR